MQAALELCVTAEAAASHRVASLPYPEKNPSRGKATSHTNKPSAEDGRIVSALVRAADERDLALARTRLREGMAAFDQGEELPRPNSACGLWSDPLPAVLIGFRSALAVGITSAFWFATAWPTGPEGWDLSNAFSR